MQATDPISSDARDAPPVHRNALVVEGGAMRGIFASGVLDAFDEHRFQPFDLAIGCSAGSCIVASYLARQRGRNHTVYTRYMTRPEFISAARFFRGGHWVDFDWLWNEMERNVPVDRVRLFASEAKFVVSATSYASGEPVFIEPTDQSLATALKGSCALPILCRDTVQFEGQRLLDGGVAAPIPVEEAYRRGARRILVVRSRPATFVKQPSSFTRLTSLAFRASPPFANALRNAHARYRAAVEFIHAPPPDCTIVHVAPDAPLATRRTTQDLRALERDFALGREAGARALETWRKLDRQSDTRGNGATARAAGAGP
jgi:predicted patatin/cPLA2 family phospholipase